MATPRRKATMDEKPDPFGTYRVVVNSLGQYSIWPAERANPVGWEDAGPTGSLAECLEYIDEVWTNL